MWGTVAAMRLFVRDGRFIGKHPVAGVIGKPAERLELLSTPRHRHRHATSWALLAAHFPAMRGSPIGGGAADQAAFWRD